MTEKVLLLEGGKFINLLLGPLIFMNCLALLKIFTWGTGPFPPYRGNDLNYIMSVLKNIYSIYRTVLIHN